MSRIEDIGKITKEQKEHAVHPLLKDSKNQEWKLGRRNVRRQMEEETNIVLMALMLSHVSPLIQYVSVSYFSI